jgi:hypothetical protein
MMAAARQPWDAVRFSLKGADPNLKMTGYDRIDVALKKDHNEVANC